MGVLSALSGDDPEAVDPASPADSLTDQRGVRQASTDLTKGEVTLYLELIERLPDHLEDDETLLMVCVAQAPVDGSLEPVPAVLALTDRFLLVALDGDGADPLRIDYHADPELALSSERGVLADRLVIAWSGGQVLQLADVSKNARNLAPAVVQQRETASTTLPPTQPGSAAAHGPGDEVLAQVRALGELHDEGVLTDEEFAAQKARLLDRL